MAEMVVFALVTGGIWFAVFCFASVAVNIWEKRRK